MSTTVIFSDLGDVDCSTLPDLWKGIGDAKVLQLTRTSEYTKDDIRDAIASEDDTLIICGHGTPMGLLGYAASKVKDEPVFDRRFAMEEASEADRLREAYGKAKGGGNFAGELGEIRKGNEETPKVRRNYTRYNTMGTVVDGSMAKCFHADRVICIWCHASSFAEAHGLYGFWSSMFISNSGEARYCGFPGVPNELIVAETTKFMKDMNGLIRNRVPMDQWVDRITEMGHMEYPTTEFNYSGLRYYPK